MPRKTTTTVTTDDTTERESAPPTAEEQLATIVHILHKMDARDRLRTIGGFIRSVIAIIPVLLVLMSAWYFYKHGDEFIKQVTEASIQSMTPKMGQQEDLMDQIQKMFPNLKISTPPSSAGQR